MVSYIDASNTLLYLTDSDPEATAETVKLGPPHAPKQESIKAFKEIEHELKKQLVHYRHDHDSTLLSLSLPTSVPTN